MLFACGYSFCSDINALTPAPVSSNNFTEVKLKNGIFDHWNVANEAASSYSPQIPTEWEINTVLNANFNGDLNAGNIDIGEIIDGFKIKRRKTTEFNWITLGYVDVSGMGTTDFVFQDNFAANLTEYEYALVPIVNGVEGNYLTETIGSKFDGVFICDADTIYRFYSGVEFGTSEQVQKIGVFEPFGRKYPVVVSNGLINYQKGSFSGNILPNNFLDGGDNSKLTNESRVAMVQEHNQLMKFLTNKKAKILKDWNSNCWLIVIAGSPTTSYSANSNMAYMSVSANYVEVGDSNNGSDLYNNGLVSEVQ